MEDYFQFLSLPRDVIKLLILKYFDPVSSLILLRLCKYFNMVLLPSEIEMVKIRRVKQIMLEQQLEWIETLDVQCELCGAEFKKESMAKHLKKHAVKNRTGKTIDRIRPPRPKPSICKLCNVPYSDLGPHREKGCPLEIVSCENSNHVRPNQWAEIVCDFKRDGYRKQIKHHDCSFRCRSCKKLFKLDVSIIRHDNGFYRHLRSCEFKMEIITLWGITLPE